MAEESIKRYTAPQILLAVAAFLIPLIGGHISIDQSLPLESGFGPLLRALLGGPFTEGFEVPLLTHGFLGLLIGAAMAVSLMQRAVIQLPNLKLTAFIIAFFGLLFISVGLSQFRFNSLATLGEWLLYALGFFTAVEVLGRKHGPKLFLGALFVGICVLALYGIGIEYNTFRALDPSHRIFAGWINPNATAGIFVIGLAIGIGLIPSAERVVALLAGIGCVLISAALFFTGSKAGFGAAVVGLGVFAILAVAWAKNRPGALKTVGLSLLMFVLGLGLFTAVQKSNQAQAPGSSLGRIGSFNETQAQSMGFRLLLLKGVVRQYPKHPTGYGLGTYRYEGSRAGLTTQTQLSHMNLSQLAFEASILAPVILLIIIALWLIVMFRGARSMPEGTNMLRAGVVAAMAATFAHGFFESNLYYFGIGLAFFMLMGVGICLSADSVAPEFTPRGARSGLAILTLLPVLLLGYFGWAEYQRTLAASAKRAGDWITAREILQGVVSFAPSDGEAWNSIFLGDRTNGEAIRRAAKVAPSARILRNLASYYRAQKKTAEAENAIRDALELDPNNLNTLSAALDISMEFGDEDQAKRFAQRMVDVEQTPYYQIRSLPQVVETATAEARIFLAASAPTAKEKIELLQGAVEILDQYAATTVPEVKKFAAVGMDLGNENLQGATEKCKLGIKAARDLAGLYRSMGNSAKSTEVEGAVGRFEAALESLGGSK